ncbi:methyl-accepting chemotaxis protein [Cohnella sp. REN36]|uniref:methyl-accepting chemotaxis protein n=1 Tax=Cohnella sp. REN36 TaxID=2887347 RepID=UPI001D148B58|nr:methyl-accepting chemotaxis protein [Cohnella sp. REN36]MCC3377104.1 methyl-accepting chemotaxis protein [Cohnella sp. REN36]
MRMPVKVRLILLLCIPLLLFAVTAVFLLQTNSANVRQMTSTLYDTAYEASSLVLNADRDMNQALSEYQRIRLGNLSPADRKKTFDDYNENVKEVNERVTAALAILEKQGLTNLRHQETYEDVSEVIERIKNGFDAWAKQASENLETAKVNEAQEDMLMAKFEQGRLGINTFGEIIDQYADAQTADVKAKNKSTTISVYIAVIIEWIVIIAAGSLLIRHLSGTISNVLNKTKQVSGGNLVFEAQAKYGKDEFGQINRSVDEMIGKMRELIGGISEHTETVASSSRELAVSAKESAAATQHVAENIQDVTAQVDVQSTIAMESSRAMEEMAVGVQRIAENTTAIADHTTSTSHQVDEGNARVQSLKQQMQDILGAIRELSAIVSSLTVKSDRIGHITENITGFANQTNILSLNASIEAARAGEHGKGFAVVAQEIRKLAASSLESAEDINGLISETRDEIANASQYMDATLSQSEIGSRMMDDVERDFDAILRSVRQVATQVHETSAITEQMSASSEEVSASMEQASTSALEISGKAQTVAAATEEQLALGENISHAAEQLQEVVRNLRNSVSFFKL